VRSARCEQRRTAAQAACAALAAVRACLGPAVCPRRRPRRRLRVARRRRRQLGRPVVVAWRAGDAALCRWRGPDLGPTWVSRAAAGASSFRRPGRAGGVRASARRPGDLLPLLFFPRVFGGRSFCSDTAGSLPALARPSRSLLGALGSPRWWLTCSSSSTSCLLQLLYVPLPVSVLSGCAALPG
jgi:hypothetical protein